MSMFINRKEELAKLRSILQSGRAELVLVYGRRRVGKSRLLLELIKNKNAIYFLSDMSKNILSILAGQVEKEFAKFSTWDDFFEYILKSKYKVFVIDEFQYLYHVDRAWPTILQRWWERIKETDKKIILCGSIISTIYRIARGYGSALYGRKTYEFHIEQIEFQHLSEFFHYSFEDLLKVYAVLGGIPRYLEEFDKTKTVEENITIKLLDKRGFLYNEPMNLLYEEFRDAIPYISIITSIIQGNTRFNEISNVSKIESHKLPKYLTTLERIGIIVKDIPVTERKIKGKITRYMIKDNFYSFWFKFVFPNKSRIEQGMGEVVFSDISKELNSFVGRIFESICKEYLIKKEKIVFTKIGRWWHKDKEIDIVALNEDKKAVLFCECKWKDEVDVEEILKELNDKKEYVKWHNDKRKESFAVFAKSFKRKIKEFGGKKVYCYDLKDIENILNN